MEVQWLPTKDQSLVVSRNSVFIFNLALDIINRISCLSLQRDGLASQRLDENLHAATETEDKVKHRILLDVVSREGAAIFELLSGKDETLLIERDSFLVLNFGFDVIDRMRRLDFQDNGFAGESFDKDLHTTGETDEVEGGFLLIVVIGERAAVYFFTGTETLFIPGDALIVLDTGLDVVDRDVRGVAGEGLDKDLHTTAETENKVQDRVVDIGVEDVAVLELLSSKDETFLVRRDALFVLVEVVRPVRLD
jgi:hypothetical protein